jgi:phenylacetate-coenzyme A ligase PaaK-like adenylate-forming protein
VEAVTGLWTLLRETRIRGQEQWFLPNRLAELRRDRLGRLLEAAGNTSYYREAFRSAGLTSQDLTADAILDRLPILEKRTLQERGSDLLTRSVGPDTVTVGTSGSTGQPLRVHRSALEQAQISAAWARIFRAYGRRTFDRQVNIGSGRSVAKKGPAALLRKLGVLQVYQLSSFDPMEHQLEVLRKVKPQLLSAYGIGLELIAEAVVSAGIEDIRPRVVYTSGTALSPRGRLLAERAFGRSPLDVYAANEVGPIAWECPAHPGALHLNDDVQITEILDEQDHPAPLGEVGQVVVTQLLGLTQPLIRYRVGDLARLRNEICPCGRGLRLMSPVLGRTQHTIRAPDGRTLNTVVVSAIMGAIPEIKRYQIKQTGARDLLLLIVPGSGWSASVEDAIHRSFQERLGNSFRYDILVVDDIRLAPSGKFQTIIPLSADQPAARS